MCFHFANFVEAQKLEDRFGANFPSGAKFDPAFHVTGFSHPEMPVITNDDPETIQLFQWGLIPFWVKDRETADDIRSKTLNARNDSIFKKASYKSPILKKRCLIPASGFFEWRHVKGNKIPHFIHLKDREIFAFGGIWENWTDKENGEILNTFSIVTTQANPMMEVIHNKKKRMPLILGKEVEKNWLRRNLNKEEIDSLMKPHNEEKMTAHTISKLITSRKHNSNVPEVIEKQEYEELDYVEWG